MPAPFPPPPHHLLVVYGSLAPGRVNYHRVQAFGGYWGKAWVRGTVQEDQGYPVFTYDPKGPELSVDLLESPNIDWTALDVFEGDNYRRILIPIRRGEEILRGNIYAWARGAK